MVAIVYSVLNASAMVESVNFRSIENVTATLVGERDRIVACVLDAQSRIGSGTAFWAVDVISSSEERHVDTDA